MSPHGLFLVAEVFPPILGFHQFRKFHCNSLILCAYKYHRGELVSFGLFGVHEMAAYHADALLSTYFSTWVGKNLAKYL